VNPDETLLLKKQPDSGSTYAVWQDNPGKGHGWL